MEIRGIKNNNWGNIRISNQKWKGKIFPQRQDKSFEVFESASYGLRALIVLLTNYYNKYNLKTITQIINKYAPPNENQTNIYILKVSKDLGVNPNQIIELTANNIKAIVKAIVQMENGKVPVNFESVYLGAVNLLSKKKD